MIKKIWFWLNVSRLFSLPMTILAWLVIFVYSLHFGGDIFNGIIALFGIAFAHLATNLTDDYFDYQQMLKDNNMMSTVVKNKCLYIKDGHATINDVLRVIVIYCTISTIIGVILLCRCGFNVFWLGVIGGLLVLFYPKLSQRGLSELAVGIAFGPLFFEGVYFVMTNSFSWEVFNLSLAVGSFIVAVLNVHTLLDFDSDMVSHKKTLCCRIGDKFKAIYLLYAFFVSGYIFTLIFAKQTRNPFILLVFLTLPYALTVCKALTDYSRDKTTIPQTKWWHKPLDNWEKHLNDGTSSFYFVLYLSRNLVTWFCALMILGFLIN